MQNIDFLSSLSDYQPKYIGCDYKVRRSAVCIPLIKVGEDYHILFERRSSRLDQHPGDVCFPGGMIEPDETPYDAAFRELSEELLTDKKNIHHLWHGDMLINGNLIVYTEVVEITDYDFRFSEDEVAQVFSVPLDFFLKTDPEEYHGRRIMDITDDDFPFDKINGGRDYKWRKQNEVFFFYEYEGIVIWGMTAKMLKSAVDAIRTVC